MKKETHPKSHTVIFRDTRTKTDFVTQSILTSKEKEKVNGEEAYVIRIDVSSASHPFFTGKSNLLDSSGRVEKFQEKMNRAQKKDT